MKRSAPGRRRRPGRRTKSSRGLRRLAESARRRQAADDVSAAVAKRYCAETDMIRSECNDGDREDGEEQGDDRDEFYPGTLSIFYMRLPIRDSYYA